ncbi:DUF805 domain-containing protein [Brevundimonas sp. NPDC003935]|uniref:DUF805 domain-containing protein n=1 Tax=unclassified Brevundimonas TaxID=2622653 RepID=UPI0028A8CC30|nr:DUF805 domain-containing protein [Brevundimonas sp.]
MKPNLLAFAFSPFGRLSRRGYWLALPTLLVVRLLLEAAGSLTAPFFGQVLLGVISLLAAWSSFVIVTRRLHDFGLDVTPLYLGWVGGWMLVFFAVFAATFIFKWDPEPAVTILGALALLAQIGFLIWAGTRPGDISPNRHGRGGSAQTPDTSVLTGYLAP